MPYTILLIFQCWVPNLLHQSTWLWFYWGQDCSNISIFLVSLHLFYFEISQVNYVKGQYKVNYSIIYLNFHFLVTYLLSESWTVCATNARFRFAEPSTISLGVKYLLQSIFSACSSTKFAISTRSLVLCLGCNVLVQGH